MSERVQVLRIVAIFGEAPEVTLRVPASAVSKFAELMAADAPLEIEFGARAAAPPAEVPATEKPPTQTVVVAGEDMARVMDGVDANRLALEMVDSPWFQEYVNGIPGAHVGVEDARDAAMLFMRAYVEAFDKESGDPLVALHREFRQWADAKGYRQ